MYLIQDKETGRYVDNYSVIITDMDEVTYSSSTGETSGFMYFTKETAQKIIHMLQKKLQDCNISKNFEIVELNKRIPKGEVVYECVKI